MAGKGSVQKRDTDGYSWQLVISNGYDKNGKKIRYTKTVRVEGRTIDSRRKAAERELALFLAEIDKGDYIEPSKLTLEEYSKIWLRDHAEKQVAPRTLQSYEYLLRSRIIPALGHLKIQDIKPLQIQKFYNNLQEEGIRQDGQEGTLSASSIRKYHALLSTMFERAVKWQIVPFSPISKVDAPKLEQKEMKCLSPENAALMLSELEKQPLKYNVFVNLALVTGCRRGEIVALQWKSIDLEKGIVKIRYSMQYLYGEGMKLKEPKTKSSVRDITIPSYSVELLKIYKKKQSEERLLAGELWQKNSDYIFTQWNGLPTHTETISKWFPKFIKGINEKIKLDKTINDEDKDILYLPEISFHALRHTAATLLIDKGLNVKAVSSRLGHAQTSTTSNIYAHALQSADRQASDMMDNILFSSQKKRLYSKKELL